MRTNVYIDGFNLYYGLLKGTEFKWLDLERFCDQLLPKNDVQRIVYCTAKVDPRPHDPDQPMRQLTYLRALSTLPRVTIEYGTFLSSVIRQPLVESDPRNGRWMSAANRPVPKTDEDGAVVTSWVLKTEEKGSDVNLAAHLMRDAYRGDCECSVIISNDSDLLTPIRMVKEDLGLVIGLVLPRPHGSHELKRLADFVIKPRQHQLANSQLPLLLDDAHGTIQKPVNW